ncbi:Pheromone-binding protein Gp-9 [Dissostichus eleginoides]|uniref:Pheromone-binding protein Gp-9 n=1 Tax=Dissostichus eleginoides TaxID=100907 RepID=A0AAD9FBT2_DISEL|nr:Pheromone-binding protein Gp-9 [Dissostichus eleginoides]
MSIEINHMPIFLFLFIYFVKGSSRSRRRLLTPEEFDGDIASIGTTSSTQKKKRRRETESDSDDPKTDAPKIMKRRWSDQERRAVQRRMGKYIALKRVPAKTDCLLCIGK